MTYETIGWKELGQGSSIGLEIVDTEFDLYYAMAFDMLERIRENNASELNTVFIVPVGPVGQYRRLAALCNRGGVNLAKVHFINMDEYLTDDDTYIDYKSPLSFRGFMDREFYNRLDPSIAMPPGNRIFPRPGETGLVAEAISKLGGLDTSYGGIGINGHIAFNEPPEDSMEQSVEEFASLPTRVLSLSRETRTINSVTAASGYIDLVPKRCITVGMREILSAKRLRFYMNREWQKGIVRKVLHGPVTSSVPASLLALHPDSKITITSQVAEMPLGQLR